MLASQRIEYVMDFSGKSRDDDVPPTKRGEAPTLIEILILSWVSGKSNFLTASVPSEADGVASQRS